MRATCAGMQNSMTNIIPAILPHTLDDLVMHLGRIRGAAPLVQIDVCDGMFVTSRTWPMNPGDRARFAQIVKGDEGLPYWEDFSFEIDFMVHSPERLIPLWIATGIQRAVIHLESRHDWNAVKDAAGDSVELGLALDLDPPFERLHVAVPRADYVQIMGIPRLGKQGEGLDDRVFGLIEKIRSEFPDVTIQVDGGVSLDNARGLIDSGADRLVVGSHIFNAPDPKDVLMKFERI